MFRFAWLRLCFGSRILDLFFKYNAYSDKKSAPPSSTLGPHQAAAHNLLPHSYVLIPAPSQMFHTLNPPSLEQQGGRVGRSIQYQSRPTLPCSVTQCLLSERTEECASRGTSAIIAKTHKRLVILFSDFNTASTNYRFLKHNPFICGVQEF